MPSRPARRTSLLPLLAVLLGGLQSASSFAEETVIRYGRRMSAGEAAALRPKAAASPASPAWGNAGASLLTLGACDAVGQNVMYGLVGVDCFFLWSPSEGYAGFPVHLP